MTVRRAGKIPHVPSPDGSRQAPRLQCERPLAHKAQRRREPRGKAAKDGLLSWLFK